MNGKEGLTHPTGKSLKKKKFAPCLLQRWHRNLLQHSGGHRKSEEEEGSGSFTEEETQSTESREIHFLCRFDFPWVRLDTLV